MIVPLGAESFREALRMGAEVFHNLKKVLHDRHLSTTVGDEGGFAPNLKSADEALDVLCKAVELAGYRLGEHITFALDPATTELFEEAKRRGARLLLLQEQPRPRRLVRRDDRPVEGAVRQVPHRVDRGRPGEDDWDGWRKLTAELGEKVQLVGDDLFRHQT